MRAARSCAHETAPTSTRSRRRKSRAGHTAMGIHHRHDPPMWRRVLIVDDNSAFRAAARQLLERNGFVVVCEAATGSSAIEEAMAHRPEVALVDLQLPDFDGFEVVERLRRLDPAPPVILTSSLD